MSEVFVSGKMHQCEQCAKKYKWLSGLLEHKRTAHAEAGHFECDVCGKLFPHKKALSDHKRIHSDPGEVVWLILDALSYVVITICKILGHPCECEHCEKILRRASDLRKHMAIHDGTFLGDP